MAYYPLANSHAEAFKKTIVKHLKIFVSQAKRDLDNKLSEAYRSTVRTPTKVISFSMVYGEEAVLSLEV